ncbi:MAG: hypothetical protein J1F35_07725 [Erysipelotrichales bacterium]|nr:hypothetical protein [Erysipelotrichales bacterium]
MNDTKEIVLFFKDDANSFSLVDVSKELMNRYHELGEPTLLPDNGNTKSPLLLFNSNPDFQIQISRVSLNFVINHVYFDRLATIIFDIVDAFEEFKCKFFRIGYISSIFLAPQFIKKVQDKFLKIENVEGIKEFNLSWYKALENKYGTINCWERFITDSSDFKDLLIQYDFNTPIDVNVDFEIKYIKEFIKTANNYIDSRMNL